MKLYEMHQISVFKENGEKLCLQSSAYTAFGKRRNRTESGYRRLERSEDAVSAMSLLYGIPRCWEHASPRMSKLHRLQEGTVP